MDQRVGMEGTESLFAKKQREERNIAVMFMVDMSGSTKGWINDIELEALDYLPRMYGPVNFTVISEVHRLPFKVSDIYRRITMWWGEIRGRAEEAVVLERLRSF